MILLFYCWFMLTKFMLNSKKLLNRLQVSEISPKIKKLDLTEFLVEQAWVYCGIWKQIFSPSVSLRVNIKTQKEVRSAYSINLWPFWNINTVYLWAKVINSRTVLLRNWMGWKNAVRFVINLEKMATRLSKRNEGIHLKIVRISSNGQY